MSQSFTANSLPRRRFKRKATGLRSAFARGSKRMKFASPVRRRRFGSSPFPAELKFFDSSKALTALVAPTDSAGAEVDPTANALNCIPTGTTMSTRDGSKVVMKSLQITGMLRVASQTAQTAADNGLDFYVAVVLDKQTNGAQLNSEDVFTNPLANGALATHPLRNMSFSKRFQVLKSINVPLKNHPPMVRSNTLATDPIQHVQSGVVIPFSMYIPLGDIITQWKTTNTDGAITDIVDNSLHVIAYTSSTDLTPNIAYNARIRFLG